MPRFDTLVNDTVELVSEHDGNNECPAEITLDSYGPKGEDNFHDWRFTIIVNSLGEIVIYKPDERPVRINVFLISN